ncbi:unnamed protein product [Nippostrongylus brasiliensis]|uniref:Fibronectin type-III domain-containing protein n=1 Tax=Nippostrongylus brasiliensis TaxID=27835 RepID=A0A0N4XLG2_NIPBR|nr:unnamed protein product [Nippostrongylus brasiliensis]
MHLLAQIRVVLSPPDVYLVWTPLREHTNLVTTFKVAYKPRNSTSWQRVYGRPDEFRCPSSTVLAVDRRADYCYHFPRLFFDVPYLTRVSYNLTDGSVFDAGSTIHFSLVQIVGVEQTARLQVAITQPRIEQQGPRHVVYWSTSGDTSQLLGYQVDLRRDGDREWAEHGPLVRSEPSQSHFRLSLGSVPVATYYLRVRALDAGGGAVATSPSTSFSVTCQPPVSPENVRLDRVSEGRVRLSWSFPTEDPACQTFFFITGLQNGQPLNHRVPGTERSFDITEPARGDWRVEVRAVNSAGSGPASQQAIFTSAQQCRFSFRSANSEGGKGLGGVRGFQEECSGDDC